MTAAPRGAIPNWHPATTADDYVRNCREGLEQFSERHFAELMGWPRIEVYRARLMAELPEDLFEKLLAAGIRSSRTMAGIALAFRRGKNAADIEQCPHCGFVLRVRHLVGGKAGRVIREWLDEVRP